MHRAPSDGGVSSCSDPSRCSPRNLADCVCLAAWRASTAPDIVAVHPSSPRSARAPQDDGSRKARRGANNLRRHHPRRRTQRPHPAGLSRQGRAQDARDRSPAGRGRRSRARWKTRAIPASCTTPTPSSSAPSPPCRGTAISSSNGTAPRYIEPELNVALLTARRPRAGMVDRLRHDHRIVRRTSAAATPTRCGAGTTSSCRSCSDILTPESRSPPLPPQRAPRAAGDAAPPAGGCSKSARSRRCEFVASGVRASDHPGGPAVLQRPARGRPALRGFGHHIAALLASPAKAQMSRGGSAALARALEAAVRESGGEHPAADRAQAHPGRERPRGRDRDRRRRSHPRPAFRRLLAQPASDLSRSARSTRSCRARSATQAERFQYNLLAPLFALHLNLREPPRYRASADHPELAQRLHGDHGARPCRPVHARSCAITRRAPSRRR